LVFDGNIPDAQPARDIETEIDEFGGFWCLNRTLWVTSVGSFTPPERIKGPHNSFGLLSLFNEEVLAEAKNGAVEGFDPVGEQYTPPIKAISKAAECLELITKAEQADIVFYFLGHHENLKLDLGNGETIGYSEFSQIIDQLASRIAKLKSSAWGLLFLNACGSGVGKNELTLRRVANKAALAGVIATEAIVPTAYAARFGERFLRSLVDGIPLGEIMNQLYSDKDFWPECLLYGYYAHPRYQVSRS
jgi:hypothetical protein